ncbi:hypothetical protein [Devosia aurantiaca]|uniref:Lysine-specific metallo-endopeptidase domain-containing protein n=1 Tax=Devosia aurantiaca TaxID=2714858 RepID=A0A6M1SMW3_9HYPH|nr:hypothetical protein [Devosia aurantiaca]NGP16862.1 hypothetical protein [Devosia aurantiaca]
MRFVLLLVAFLISLTPARADVIDDALNAAASYLAAASPQMAKDEFGVDVGAYRDALTSGSFTSRHWGQSLAVDVRRSGDGGDCARFAAFVTSPPQNGAITLSLCPQFINGGTLELRTLTILHEMVHVVAGPNECRAMAFAARVEFLATGGFTPVDRYWQANGCGGSGFALP